MYLPFKNGMYLLLKVRFIEHEFRYDLEDPNLRIKHHYKIGGDVGYIDFGKNKWGGFEMQ